MAEFAEQTLQDAKAEMRLRVLAFLYHNSQAPHISDTQIARLGARHHTKTESEDALTDLMGRFVEAIKGTTDRVFVLTDFATRRVETRVGIEGINPEQPIDLMVLIRRALAKVDSGVFVPGECAELWNRVAHMA